MFNRGSGRGKETNPPGALVGLTVARLLVSTGLNKPWKGVHLTPDHTLPDFEKSGRHLLN